MRLPDSLAGLFRNYGFDALDDERHRGLIVRTVLARGTWEQILWLFRRYGRDGVREVFVEDYYGPRTLPDATRRLWELMFIEQPPPDDPHPAARWRCRRAVVTNRGPER